MTQTIEDLARAIQKEFAVDSYGAALTIVGQYVDQLTGDPTYWNPDTNELTEDGAAALEDLVYTAGDGDGHFGREDHKRMLEAITETAMAITEKTAERDSLIKAAMGTEIPREDIAEASGLSIPRLYQIRGPKPTSGDTSATLEASAEPPQ